MAVVSSLRPAPASVGTVEVRDTSIQPVDVDRAQTWDFAGLSIGGVPVGAGGTPAQIREVTGPTTYAVLADDQWLLLNAAAGSITVTLPGGATSRALHFKRTDESANACTLDGNGQTIDGAASVALDGNRTAMSVVRRTTNWNIF